MERRGACLSTNEHRPSLYCCTRPSSESDGVTSNGNSRISAEKASASIDFSGRICTVDVGQPGDRARREQVTRRWSLIKSPTDT
jgi:hypothetical protein